VLEAEAVYSKVAARKGDIRLLKFLPPAEVPAKELAA